MLSRRVAEAAAQGEPGDAGHRHEAEHGGEAVQLRFLVDVAEQAAGLGAGDLRLAIHPDAAHRRHVEKQAAVADREAGDVVTAALDGQRHALLAREAHAGLHVGDSERTGDRRRPPVDHRVPHRSGCLIARRARTLHGAAQAGGQRIHRICRQDGVGLSHARW